MSHLVLDPRGDMVQTRGDKGRHGETRGDMVLSLMVFFSV